MMLKKLEKFLILALFNLYVSEAIQWNHDSHNNLYWAMGCDFHENNLKNQRMKGENCGPACVSTPGCTHFTWTNYQDGTCWMKRDSITRGNAFAASDSSAICGVINQRDTVASQNGIQWSGNWAFSCDFFHNDLTNARIPGYQCSDKCSQTPECTHFVWTTYNGGTCWMKKGIVSKSNAYKVNDNTQVCGVLSSENSNSEEHNINTGAGDNTEMSMGVNYDAMHNSEYPLHGGSVDLAALGRAIDRDFAQISKHFKHVRTFYSSFYSVPVAPYAAKYGVKLYLGVYMTDKSWYKGQVDAAIEAVRKYPGTVLAVLVGNENLRPNGPYTANDILSRVNNIRSRIRSETGTNVPVGTVQRISEWLNQGISSETSKLANACDILGVNIYPFFGNYDYSNPIKPLEQQWNAMISKYGSEKVRLTETGYPTSGGSSPSGVRADLSAAKSYFNAVSQWKPKGKGPAFWFSFHDRRADDNSVPGEYEKHFGLVNADGSAKANNFPPLAK